MTNEIEPAAAADASRPKRIMGLTGQGVGIVGIVVCLLLIVGVVFARGWALDTLTGVSTRVDTNLAKGIPLLEKASTKVADISGKVSTLADAATAVAASPNPTGAIVQAFTGEVSGLSERYLALRSQYSDARAQIKSALDQLKTLDTILPFFSIPQGPLDAIERLDARIQDLDAKVMELIGTNPAAEAISTVAASVAEKATGLEGQLAEATTALADARTKLDGLRSELASTTATATTAINVLSILMVIGLIYLTALHVVLYRAAKGVGDAPDA